MRGEQHLREFQDNEKTIPTVLTTSQKLSTGVDARNIRNIVLLRPIHSMIEFKQIIGRGTRLFEGKEYFTIIDFVDAYKHFSDPEWDGEPIDLTTDKLEFPDLGKKTPPSIIRDKPSEKKKKIKIKLRDGKEREIQYMISISYWNADGKPVSSEEFIQIMFGKLPELFKSEEELRKIWSNPITRKVFMEKMSEIGYGKKELEVLQKIVNAEESDLFDALAYVAFAISPISRNQRVMVSRESILTGLDQKQKEFLEFVLKKYIEKGVEELDEEKLPGLLNLKYHAISDAEEILGGVDNMRATFFDFQKNLYAHYLTS